MSPAFSTYELTSLTFYWKLLIDAQGIGDVSGDHEIQLGNWHHGRVTIHGDYQKNHIGKYLPAIFVRK